MPKYSVADVMALREKFTDLPYPDFSLANIVRRRAPATGSLVRGDNAYVPGKAVTSDDAIKKQVQSALNKLAEENYAQILAQLQSPLLLEETAIAHFVHLIFQKSLQEPKYSPMYAQLCYDMAKFEVQMSSTPSSSTEAPSPAAGAARQRSKFRDAIVVRTQSEFQEDVNDHSSEDAQAIARRKKANIKFVGQLYLRKVLSERIMFSVLTSVLHLDDETHAPAPIEIEVLTELLGTIGERLDASSDGFVDLVFDRLKALLVKKPAYDPRIHFKIMDIVDLRSCRWILRDASKSQSQSPADAAARRTVTGGKPPMPLQSPKSMATPISKGAAFKFPDAPQAAKPAVSAAPGSWLKATTTKTAAQAAPSAAKAAPIVEKPTVSIEKKIDEVYSEFADAAVADWKIRFAGYGLSDENLAIGIVAKITTDACLSTSKDAQTRAAAFFKQGLQLSKADSITGFAKMLTKSIDEDIVSDTPKLFERFVAILGAVNDNVSGQFTDLCSVLFSSLTPLSEGEYADEAIESLMAVWNTLPKDVTVNATVVDVVLRSRGNGALQASLSVAMLTHLVVDNKIAPAKPIAVWAASPGGIAAKEFRALLTDAGVLSK